MKHPNREQWVSFLYEECEPAEKNELSAHLESCAACREQLQTWRNAAVALNDYTVGARAGERTSRRAWLPLSAAAAVLLTAGIVIGNTFQARAGAAANSQLVAELRSRVEKSETENARTQRLLVDLTQTMAANRAQDQAALLTVAQEVKATHKELETVAVYADAGLKRTENQLVRLASYTSP